MDCISDVLCTDDVTRPSERVRSEAAGVVAQVTSPSLVISPEVHELRHTSLISNMADLVPALTGMACLCFLLTIFFLVANS